MRKKTKNSEAELQSLSAAELRTRFREITGAAPKSPNRKHQIKVILQNLADKAKARPAPAASAGTDDGQRLRFRDLSISDLHKMYEEVVGRPTQSTNRSYLIWKIREAKAGRVKVGPRKLVDPGEKQVLPFTLSTEKVKVLDEMYKRHGYRSRTALLRAAVRTLLAELNEHEASRKFQDSSSQD